MAKPLIFIDGEAGTTGLEIRKRLEKRTDIEIISIAAENRKDASERARLINLSQLVILCLPDDAAREAVTLVTNPRVKIIDASTVHRTAPGWTYGFPELSAEQEGRIRSSTRVSNPGCYPTGALALLRPLVDSGILPTDFGVTINAISGYSGGGKDLIALCENKSTNTSGRGGPFCLYGVDQQHKHIPEMMYHSGLKQPPVFLPAYSNAFYRGMLVQIAVHSAELSTVGGSPVSGELVHGAINKHFAESKYIRVEPYQTEFPKNFFLSPLEQNHTNNVQLRVIADRDSRSILLTACLDNLGKGASGAVVQNMDIMLGL